MCKFLVSTVSGIPLTVCVRVCVLEPQDAESKPQCRRLQLKDIIPTEMQRLTKYPLLLENIAKNTGLCLCAITLSFLPLVLNSAFTQVSLKVVWI